jgi:hypothetical protein
MTRRGKRSNTMKHTAILGALFITSMTLGMSPLHENVCCNSYCFSPMLTTCLQPGDMEREHPRGPNGMQPQHMSPNSNQENSGMQRKMPANMIEHIMAVAQEIDPGLASQLAQMCESDPDAFHKICRRQGQRLGSLIRLRESDPELYEVKVTEFKTDAEIYKTAEELRGLDMNEPHTQAKIAELQGLVRARTALSLRAQTLHIGRLEDHILGLQAKLKDTSSRFDEIVNERVEQLIDSIQKTNKVEATQTE